MVEGYRSTGCRGAGIQSLQGYRGTGIIQGSGVQGSGVQSLRASCSSRFVVGGLLWHPHLAGWCVVEDAVDLKDYYGTRGVGQEAGFVLHGPALQHRGQYGDQLGVSTSWSRPAV